MKHEPRIGRTFGRLTVVGRSNRPCTHKNYYYACQCDCGGTKEVAWTQLRLGHTKSCGCLAAEWEEKQRRQSQERLRKLEETRLARREEFERNSVGGVAPTVHPLWGTYKKMIARCYNQNAHNYKYYGGRGITVINMWHREGTPSVEGLRAFVSTMGEKPSPAHTLDRIDVNGPYSPDNCRWADPITQHSNTRCGIPARTATIRGVTRLLAEWCKKFDVQPEAVKKHAKKHGLTLECAILYAYLAKRDWKQGRRQAPEKNIEEAKRRIASGVFR